MSFNRLRHLAGLNESFTHDPAVNKTIEQAVDQQAPDTRPHWMDLLEMIYLAGDRGISRHDIVEQMYALYSDASRVFGSNGLDDMMDTIDDRFANLVKTSEDGDWFAWAVPSEEPETLPGSTQNDMDVEREVDPTERRAINAQVDMTSQILALMRQMTQQHGSFTMDNLTQHLHQTMHIPAAMARPYAEHIIAQFPGEITQQNGRYVMKPEQPPTDTMDMLRRLARRP